jgi:dTDP-4-dehydrorhamnose reductase
LAEATSRVEREFALREKTRNLLTTGATSALAGSLIHFAAKESNYRILAVSRSDKPIEVPEGLIEFKRVSGIDLTTEKGLQTLANSTQGFLMENST